MQIPLEQLLVAHGYHKQRREQERRSLEERSTFLRGLEPFVGLRLDEPSLPVAFRRPASPVTKPDVKGFCEGTAAMAPPSSGAGAELFISARSRGYE